MRGEETGRHEMGRAVEGDRNKDGVKCSFPPQGKQPGKIIVVRRQRKATNDSRQ